VKLLHGDCLEVMKSIPDKSIDMILCDLPYGTTACKWDTVIPFEPLWKQYKRIIKDRGCIALFGSEPFSSYLRMSNIKQYKYDWVWEKDKPSNFATAKKIPMKYHENIIIFNAGNYYPQMFKGDKPVNKSAKYGRTETEITGGGLLNNKQAGGNTYRYPKSIYKCNVVNNQSNEKTKHSTQKPVALLEYLIKTYTLEGETVLDNCMGSGSTGVACVNTGRDFIGIEKDKTYFEIAKKRINKAQKGIVK